MISKKMEHMVANSSAIRAMFEEGTRMAKEFGKENVYDFSLGNPNVPAPKAVKAAIAELLEAEDKNGTYLAAICAAPSVFGGLGLTEGKKASIYPGMEEALVGANVSFDPVSVDGHLVTSRGVGTAIPFALKLVELLCDAKKAEEIGKSIVFA